MLTKGQRDLLVLMNRSEVKARDENNAELKNLVSGVREVCRTASDLEEMRWGFIVLLADAECTAKKTNNAAVLRFLTSVKRIFSA